MMRALCVSAASVAVLTGLAEMKSAPLWDLAKDGGALSERLKRDGFINLCEKGFDVPGSAVPDQSAFTAEATLTFHDLMDNRFMPLLSHEMTETGWGLGLLRCSNCGSPVLMRCNAVTHAVSYGMQFVEKDSTHTFTITARRGVMVVYMDGKVQRSYFMKPTPVPGVEPIRVGYAPEDRWMPELAWASPKPMAGVELRSLKFWDGNEEYYAPGEPRSPAIGYAGGVGWQMEVSAKGDDSLPKVLYFGDSISDGYGEPFKVLAEGKLNLYHWTHFENDIDKLKERLFDEVLAFAKYDVIVFNNGLHSLDWTPDKVSDERIANHYRMLVKAFRKRAPQAKLVFVNCTPLTGKKGPSGKVETLADFNDKSLRFNRIAAKVMKREKVPVVDAYSLLAANLGEARGDQYHWNPSAYRKMAQLIFDKVNEVLGSRAF